MSERNKLFNKVALKKTRQSLAYFGDVITYGLNLSPKQSVVFVAGFKEDFCFYPVEVLFRGFYGVRTGSVPLFVEFETVPRVQPNLFHRHFHGSHSGKRFCSRGLTGCCR